MTKNTRGSIMASLCLLALTSAACSLSPIQIPTAAAPATQAPAALAPAAYIMPKARTVFFVTPPQPLATGEILALGILDEVTGLGLGGQLFPMQSPDGVTYSATLALPLNGVIKYHYVRLGTAQVQEATALNETLRYRMYHVTGLAEVRDIIGSWADRPYSGQIGSIDGHVLNAETGAPVPDILVTAGGERYFTDSAGRFDLPGLVPGTHNVVAYAPDATYEVFQQGATVAQGLSTDVEIKLKAVPLVRVSFDAAVPDDPQGAPVRIAGNLLELGNTFADLRGGMSTVADRMPVMTFQADGHCTVTLSLPVGAYVQYKYTLGDGFWNAEYNSAGESRLRELIVPSQAALVQDKVEAWQAGSSSAIQFDVTVSSDTPAADLIYIQFNPYGWTEPIPMWPMGNNHWSYNLYGPLNALGNLHYRYCRDGQCGSADDLSTAGDAAQGHTIAPDAAGKHIQDTVKDWAWLQNTEPTPLASSAITARPDGFVSGVEFQSGYHPSWSYYSPQAVQGVQALGANWLFFTPGWTYARSAPLEFGLAPEHDPFWLDMAIMVSQARAADLNVAIFPTPRFDASAADFWKNAPRDAAWWQNWFDHYRAFLVQYADLAAQTGSQAIVIGGDWLQPALPNGTLQDGSASGVPADATLRWQAIISEVRQHFTGKVWWAAPYAAGGLQTSLDLLTAADGIYLLWSAPLSSQAGATTAAMATQAGTLLDDEISPVASVLNKPVMLALAYPSASGAETGCLDDGQGGCMDWSALNQPQNPGSLSLDLQAQSDLYQAMLTAIDSRPWISGIISRGYYPPIMLQDKSASVHGKPAADLLWYWFPRLTGVIK